MASSWFRETPESLRAFAEESALLEASEIIAEALISREVTRKTLAERLEVPRSEITQRLSGKRNLTIRSVAAMLHELDYDLQLRVRDRQSRQTVWHRCGEVHGASEAGVRYTSGGGSIRIVKSAA